MSTTQAIRYWAERIGIPTCCIRFVYACDLYFSVILTFFFFFIELVVIIMLFDIITVTYRLSNAQEEGNGILIYSVT